MRSLLSRRGWRSGEWGSADQVMWMCKRFWRSRERLVAVCPVMMYWDRYFWYNEISSRWMEAIDLRYIEEKKVIYYSVKFGSISLINIVQYKVSISRILL